MQNRWSMKLSITTEINNTMMRYILTVIICLLHLTGLYANPVSDYPSCVAEPCDPPQGFIFMFNSDVAYVDGFQDRGGLHTFRFYYTQQEGSNTLINEVTYKLPTGSLTTAYGQLVELDVYTFGETYIQVSQLKDVCGNVYTGPGKTLTVLPSCYGDTFGGWTVTGPDGDIAEINGGFQVESGISYTLNAAGVDHYASHYDLISSDPDQLTVNFETGEFIVSAESGSFSINAVKQSDRESCPDLSLVKLFVEGADVVLESHCPIVLPDDLEDFGYDPGSPVFDNFAYTVKSDKGIVVKPGIVLESGAEFFLEPGTPTANTDLHMNFVEQRSYNEYGEPISASRNYFDNMGRSTQSQYKHFERDVIMASEVLYDADGRAVITTQNAPVWEAETSPDDECETQLPGQNLTFKFRENFVTAEPSTAYNHSHFDLDNELTPRPVDDSEPGTLGWYYGPSNDPSVSPAFAEPLIAVTKYPYSRTLYHRDGSGEPKGGSRPGDTFKAGGGRVPAIDTEPVSDTDAFMASYLNILRTELGLTATDQLMGNYYRRVSFDEKGYKSITYHDDADNLLISQYYADLASPITQSFNFYDYQGRLIVAVSPNGVEQYTSGTVPFDLIDKTTYTHNYKGLVTAMVEPDAGLTEFIYTRDGKVRFSQNARQREVSSFSYTNYDRDGRPVESGEFTPSGTLTFDSDEMLEIVENTDPDGGLVAGTKADQTFTWFDLPDPNIPVTRIQENLFGAVSYTKNDQVTTWYSYDYQGRTKWMVQQIIGLGVKTIDYRYGKDGNVREVAYQKGVGGEEFYHYYTYDKDGILDKVYAGRTAPEYDLNLEVSNIDQLTLQVNYEYYLHGPLKRVELATDLQGIDYLYTADGTLKAINSDSPDADPGNDHLEGGFRPDLFGMTLHYFTNDYTGAGYNTSDFKFPGYPNQFSGNIRAISWDRPDDRLPLSVYAYRYDKKYQLSQADLGTRSATGEFVADPGNAYQVSQLDYDANGNIKRLRRKNVSGADRDYFKYHYDPGKNQLQKLTDRAETQVYRQYDYDETGRMKWQQIDNVTTYLRYDVSGKTMGVYKNHNSGTGAYSNPLVTFTYDDRGFRLSKTAYDDSGSAALRTWYVRDAGGTLMSIHSEDMASSEAIVQEEVPVYGAGRIAVFKPQKSIIFYEIADHLGNVRTVIGKPVPVTFSATMERNQAQEEEQYFIDLDESRSTVPDFINHTPGKGTDQAIRLNNYRMGRRQMAGPSIALKVNPGDTLRSEVFTKYFNPKKKSKKLNALMLALPALTGVTATGVDQFATGSVAGGNGFLPVPLGNDDGEDNGPGAYLNYILFDKDMNRLDAGFVSVSEAAEIPEENPELHGHERLTQEVIAKAPGFAYFYVSSSSKEEMEVFFDDFRVTQTVSDVVVVQDYYPFGLPMEERSIEEEDYRFKYQGQFAEQDKETGFSAFELRMYDPVIGRWTTTDPAGQYWSPYVGMGNNPAGQIDPDGAYSKPGAWWRNIWYGGSGIYESSGEWGFNKGTGRYTWETWQLEGGENIHVRHEITEFRVGQFGEGSTIALLSGFKPNFAGRVKGFIDNSSGPINFFGEIGYNIADNAYISLFQLGGDRRNLEGFGVNNNEVTDAGANTLMTLNPIGRTSTTLFKGVNIGTFNKYVKGSFIARLQPQWKGYILRAYNSLVHKGRIKTTMSAVGAGAKATDAALNDD